MSAPPDDVLLLDDSIPLPPIVTRRSAPAAASDDAAPLPPFVPGAGRPVEPDPAAGASPPEPPVPARYAVEPAEPSLSPATPSEPEQAHAAAVAARLEQMAADLRRFGFRALLEHQGDQEAIDAVIAAVLAGYLAHR